jgi:acetyl-CoA acetyltransferase
VICVAGAAEFGTPLAPEGATASEVMGRAALAALRDAGIAPARADGLWAASTQLPWASLNLGEELGVAPRASGSTMLGGASAIAHMQEACAALERGACDVAVVAYGSTQRTVGRAAASVQEIDPYEAPYDPPLPLAAYALAAARHAHEFGTTPEQLAWVAVSARRWARRRPDALRTEELTVDDVLAAPRLCDPLGTRDCCLVTDGGAALVLVREADLPAGARPVRVLGAATAASHRHVSSMPDLVRTAAADSGRQAFEQAGIGPQDLDSAQLYDAFTITSVLQAEDLGLCPKGEGGAFFEGGATGPGGGGLPVGTSGGGLSYAHPGMNGAHLLVEGVRRVRGGDRHVLVHGNGGVFSAQATAVLGA